MPTFNQLGRQTRNPRLAKKKKIELDLYINVLINVVFV